MLTGNAAATLSSEYILFKKQKKNKKTTYIAMFYRNGQKFYSNSDIFWNPVLLRTLHFV